MALGRRLLFVLYVAAASAVLLEVVLQVGHAVVVWREHRGRAATASEPGALDVLCVGDSYTFGVGASDPEHAYPAALERLLEARLGAPVTVRNAGWPSQNTWDVASRLAEQLDPPPAFVVVLAATNDAWQPPRRFEPAPGASGSAAAPHPVRSGESSHFRFELRTPRLFALVMHRLHGRERTVAPAATKPSSGDDDVVAQARDALLRSAYHEALERARQGAELHPELRDELQSIELNALMRLGRRAEVETLLAAIEHRYRESPSRRHAELYLQALDGAGHREESIALAAELVELHPDLTRAWWILGWRASERGDRDAAAHAFERGLAALPAGDDGARADATRWLAGVVDDRDRALALLIDAALLDGNAERTAAPLRAALGDEAASRLRAYAASPAIDETRRRLALELLASLEAPDPGADAASASEANLERIAESVRGAGAVPLFLTYPFCDAATSAIQQRAAASTGALLVDTCARFAEELAVRPRDELFVADGHLTDAGYAIVAELVADAIVARRGAAALP